MRINRLDLLRYGCFTNVALPFSKAISDLHVIFGPNEAGKSTSLAGIEDLLFGIAHNSPYNFVHDYVAMRVGGVLEHDGRTLEVRRRKGNKDTLLAHDDNPLPSGDGSLAPFLGGADRAFLMRMFSLNHERLAQGGREILEAKDEVGQTLFSAGAGLSGLHERMASLAKEADELWAPRRAGRRRYYMALDALEEADKAQRDNTVTASKWQETKRTLEAAEEAYEAVEKLIEEKSTEQRKLSRIRRVYRQVRKLTEVETELSGLGEVPSLPDDAETQLTTATHEQSDAQSKIEVLDGQLKRAISERSGLQGDESLLMRLEEIGHLHTQRIEVHKEKADLPKRRADLAAKEQRLSELAEDLGWEKGDSATIIARIPQRARITAIRTLLAQRGELTTATSSAQTALEEIQEQIRELQEDSDRLEAARDVSSLAAVIRVTREVADVGSRIKAAEKELADANNAVEKGLRPLRPQVSMAQDMEAIPVPPRNVVQSERDTLRDLEKEAQSCREKVSSAESAIAQHRRAYERLKHDEEAVARVDLDNARQDRDAGWALIRRRYVDGLEVPEPDIAAFCGDAPDLSTAYEERIATADTLADRRFDKAEAAGQIAAVARQIADAEETLAALRKEESEIDKRRRDFEARWQTLWTEAPFDPLPPEFMLEWLDSRTAILDLVEKGNAAAALITALQKEEADARTSLLAELTSLGEDATALEGQSLRFVLEAASAVQQRHEKRAENKEAIDERIRKCKTDETRKQARLDKAQGAWADWLKQWSSALASLAFAEDAMPETVGDHLDAIDEMRSVANEINQLKRDRIAKIERDVEGFATSCTEVVNAVAPDLAVLEPEASVLELEVRLEEAKRIRDQQIEKDKTIESLGEKIEEWKEVQTSSQRIIEKLQELAGVEGLDQLREIIRLSRRRDELKAERTNLERTLVAEGDGLPFLTLSEECAGVDLDQTAARERTLQDELKDLHNRLTPATELRGQARRDFEAIGGDGRAARAAAARQEALASMRDVAEQYVRVRTAATLLQWAIDRYRREKQAPLLKRAGQMFSTLTGGSFADLRVEYDDQDHARLAGIRPDQSSVSIDGMSDGTADQLYLSLRLASVDEYLSRAHSLPFIADDLLINFSDARAAAAFKVLAELGQKTQILFFTHHQHLVDIARATLGKGINVICLAEDTVSSAA
jgi:uncharacterized protein YhaN